jgi:hypothetical protein
VNFNNNNKSSSSRNAKEQHKKRLKSARRRLAVVKRGIDHEDIKCEIVIRMLFRSLLCEMCCKVYYEKDLRGILSIFQMIFFSAQWVTCYYANTREKINHNCDCDRRESSLISRFHWLFLLCFICENSCNNATHAIVTQCARKKWARNGRETTAKASFTSFVPSFVIPLRAEKEYKYISYIDKIIQN